MISYEHPTRSCFTTDPSCLVILLVIYLFCCCVRSLFLWDVGPKKYPFMGSFNPLLIQTQALMIGSRMSLLSPAFCAASLKVLSQLKHFIMFSSAGHCGGALGSTVASYVSGWGFLFSPISGACTFSPCCVGFLHFWVSSQRWF